MKIYDLQLQYIYISIANTLNANVESKSDNTMNIIQ